MDFLEALSRPPLVLGIDPRPELHPIPPLAHIERYSFELMERLAPKLAAVKFQTAFFEALGPLGSQLFHRLLAGARVLGLPVIIDGKRGDIGSTAEAYARAYLEAYPGSALTVHPYLGPESLRPLLKAAQTHGGAIFVLLRTSNPEAEWIQEAQVEGEPLYLRLARWLAQEEARYLRGDWSAIGGVVGLNHPEAVWAVRAVLPRSPLLLPGLGAQGGHPLAGPGFLNTASRSLYYPGGVPHLERAEAQASAYLEALKAS
jgi:orotidine-5'-phosphate decarboxylase